jgi:hypothetical protein
MTVSEDGIFSCGRPGDPGAIKSRPDIEMEEEMAAQKRLMAEFETRLRGIRSSKD